mgnify:CR=1 FL=1
MHLIQGSLVCQFLVLLWGVETTVSTHRAQVMW